MNRSEIRWEHQHKTPEEGEALDKRRRSFLRRVAVGGFFALLLSLFGFAAPSSATTTEPSKEIISSSSTANVTTSEKAEAVNGISISSDVTVLAYIQANGATKAQKKGKDYRLTKGRSLWTSYYNVAGQEVWHLKYYPKGKKFDKGKDGWYHDPDCWNKVKVKVKKKVPASMKLYGKVHIVKEFVFSASSTAVAQGDAVAKARAWCSTEWNYAEATGSGNASFRADASATGTGRTWVEAYAAAKSNSQGKLNLQIGSKLALEVSLKATAEGKATADATAQVTCSAPPPPPPPVVEPPTFMQFREFNDLEVNWTSDHCVTVDFPSGNSGSVFWEATFGSFATPSKPAQDSVQVCSTYKAPSEVPSGGTDVIKVTATDGVTGKSVTQSSRPFVIHPTAAPPL